MEIIRMMVEQYFKTPFYSVRRLKVWLQNQGINRIGGNIKRGAFYGGHFRLENTEIYSGCVKYSFVVLHQFVPVTFR